MPFVNTIDINGEIYNLGNLSDGYHIVDLPNTLTKNDTFILQGDVVDSLDKLSENTPHNKPLSAYQGKKLDEKIDALSQSSSDNDTAIINDLNDEILRATSEDERLDTKIEAETDRATSAENTLTANLDAEIIRAKDAEKVLTDNLSAETTRAEQAENTLTTNLNSEISRAKKAESDLTTAISTEKGRIDTFLASADVSETAIDTLKEIQDYINTHGEAATTMTSKINKNASNIEALQSTVGASGDSSTGLFKAIEDAETSAKTYADNNFIKKTSIADDLTTDSSDKVLSAKQGKALSDNKVDKEDGKGLSTNDYTTVEKNKLAAIAEGANNYTHPTYPAQSSGLYKITVDSTGHISAVTPATKEDIVFLGIPAQDTVYTLPVATSTEIGGVKISSDYTTGADDVAASTSALKAAYDYLLGKIEALENPST